MNTYLISAESYHIINEEINKIVKNDYILFNMNKTSIDEVIAEASYFSLDDNKKYLVVNNADFFGSGKLTDEDSEKIIKYVENPNPSTVLIFTTQEGIDSRKKVVKSIKNNGNVINIPKMDKKAINNYLNNYLKEKSFKIDYQTVNFIMDNSYSNLDIMINDLDKIMIYYNKPCQIDYNDVKKIIGEQIESNNFKFVNAVIEKDLKSALKILKGLKTYKVETTSLVLLLAREYRLMYYVKTLNNKMSLSELMSYLKLADWQINKLYTNSSKFTQDELLNNLVSLCNIDLNIKKGIWDKDIALHGFLLDACS